MEIQYPSKLIVDSEVYINIYFKNSDYRLQSGYINCKLDSAFSVDSTRLKITGCAVQLYRRNDSLQIYFTIPKDGIKGFSIGRATILFQDKKGKYFAADTLVGFDLSN